MRHAATFATPVAMSFALAALPAQTANATTAAEPLLRVASGNRTLLDTASMLVDQSLQRTAAPAGKHIELSIGADRAFAQTVVDGELDENRVLVLTVRPAAWLRALGDEARELEKDWRARLTAIATTVGIERAQAKQLLPQLLDVARGIERVELDVVRKGDGGNASLRLVAVTGSEFDRWQQLLTAGKRGVVPLAADGDLMQLAWDLPADRVAGLLEPFVPWFAAMAGGPTAVEDFRRSLASTDGTMTCAMGPQGMRMIAGLTDAKSYAAVALAADYLERTKTYLAKQRLDVEYTVDALDFRGMRSLKSVMLGDKPQPMLGSKDGDVTGYVLIGDAMMVSVAGGPDSKAAVEKLATAALDGAIARKPLFAASDTTPPFLTMAIDLHKAMELAPAGATAANTRERALASMPATLRMSMHRTGTAVELHFVAQ